MATSPGHTAAHRGWHPTIHRPGPQGETGPRQAVLLSALGADQNYPGIWFQSSRPCLEVEMQHLWRAMALWPYAGTGDGGGGR